MLAEVMRKHASGRFGRAKDKPEAQRPSKWIPCGRHTPEFSGPIFREHVKKSPETRISVIADNAVARGTSPPMTDPRYEAARCRLAGVFPSRCPACGRPIPGAIPSSLRGGHRAVPARVPEPGAKPVPVPDRTDLN